MTDIPDNSPSPLETEPMFREASASDEFTPQEVESISQRLGSLVIKEDTILFPHQVEAFEDAVEFFKTGGRECYLLLPTGSGKTVIMVEMCEQLLASTPENERKPRILVLEPTIDLVKQTVGSIDARTGKKRGFKGFAPHIDVRPLHGKVSTKDRQANLLEAEVLVTTYDSFRNLVSELEIAESKTPEEWDAEKRKLLDFQRQAEARKPALIRARAEFIHQAYYDQKIAQAKLRVSKILSEKDQLTLSEDDTKSFQALDEILNSEVSDRTKLRLMRKHVRALINPKVSQALNAYADTQKRANERRKINDKRIKSGLSRIEWESTDEEEEAKVYKRLSEPDKVVMQFVLNSRLKDRPTRVDLERKSDRDKVANYSSEIQDLSSSAQRAKHRAEGIDYYKVVATAAGFFDLFVGDEFHRAIGEQTWTNIRAYAKRRNIALLGLTATDEYPDRHLENFVDAKAHELTKLEAIKRKIINPVAMFVHDTGLRFQNATLDPDGEYDHTTLREMRFSEERNKIIVDKVRILSEFGYKGIVSAIPGDEGAHAKVLAEMINQQEIIDPTTGQTRLLRARYVLQNSAKREEYYRQLEAGELDWLSFIDVIREGWDSDVTKALVNGRATRSPLLATQRAGRTGRTYPGAPVSVVVDIVDGIRAEGSLDEIPPVTMADIYDLDDIQQGYIIGGDGQPEPPVIAALRETMQQPIIAYHNRHKSLLAKSLTINANGMAVGEMSGVPTRWQTFEAMKRSYQGFLPKEIIIDAVEAEPPLIRATKGHRGYRTLLLLSAEDVQNLHNEKPEVNPWKLHVDADGQRWIAPEGCVIMLSKRFPQLHAEQISDAIRELEETSGQHFEREVGRVQLGFNNQSRKRYGLTSLYKIEEITERLVPYLVEAQG